MPRSSASSTVQHTFRPRARLLRLLGDQLIRDASIAVFELVKNAYDADATEVTVTITNVTSTTDSTITVEDNGCGMDLATVTGVWMEPGTDFRQRQRSDPVFRTPDHNRLPLGEKGVGRFAVDKLGTRMTMVTRRKGKREVVVKIDWDELASEDYLDAAEITVVERGTRVFRASNTGTRIEIESLRQRWDRRSVRSLHRSMTAISSPFYGPDDFDATLKLDPDPRWLDGLLSVGEIMEQALFRASGTIAGASLSFDYEFTPLPAMDRVNARTEHHQSIVQGPRRDDPVIDLSKFEIGDVGFELLIFDREPQVLALGVTDKAGLKEFLDQNGGVRVYRDGVRVYDYGEPEDDWLSLDAARVNVPTRRISNNIVIGAVALDLANSAHLVEKTNREGFVENDAYEAFREAVRYAVQQVAVERNIDKDRIRKAYAKRQRQPVLDALDDLRSHLERRKLLDELRPQVDAVERDFVDMRDQLLTAAGAGLSLSVVIHEVDKSIADLNRALDRDAPVDQIRNLAHHLADLVTGLTHLVRRSGSKAESAAAMVRHSLFNVEYRLEHHGVVLTNAFTARNDFKVRCIRRLIIASIMNLVDNSIWWLDVGAPRSKRLWIGPTDDLEGPAIVIADNGPGFLDPPEVLTQPFMSRRTEGMGLGLHLASEVMRAQGGRLAFPDKGDVALPRGMNGAVVALVFKGNS